jgi:DNA-binding NarL/FixJ family response regulator
VGARRRGSARGQHGAAITPRQLAVLRLVTAGLPNREIARQLGISEAGVKFHVSALLRHYGVDNRVAMVVSSLRRDLTVERMREEQAELR